MRDAASTTTRSIVVRLGLRAPVLAAIRGGLSALGAVAAMLVGANLETTLLGWVVGAMMVSIILASDRRGRSGGEPAPMPEGTIPQTWSDIARTDVFPSTVGVSLFALVALAVNPVLAGVMSGILGGMALMTVLAWIQVAVAERKLGGVLYIERGTRRLYVAKP